MQLALLEARTYARCGWDNANPGAAVITRIRGFINETYHEIMAKKGMETLRRVRVDFAATPGYSLMALPAAITRVYSIFDRTNGRMLDDVSTQDIIRRDPHRNETGNPTGYSIYNLNSPVVFQPIQLVSTGSPYLAVWSDSVTDTTPKQVRIQGVDTSGFPVSTFAVLNGTANVAIPPPPGGMWTLITKFYLQNAPTMPPLANLAVADGTLLLGLSANGLPPFSPLSSIRPGRSAAHFSTIVVYPTPTAGLQYSADAELFIEDLVQPGDEPLFPDNYHSLLSIGAAMKEYTRREKTGQLVDLKREYGDLLGDLLVFANRQVSDLRPAPAGLGLGMGWSQLGSLFPAGS